MLYCWALFIISAAATATAAGCCPVGRCLVSLMLPVLLCAVLLALSGHCCCCCGLLPCWALYVVLSATCVQCPVVRCLFLLLLLWCVVSCWALFVLTAAATSVHCPIGRCLLLLLMLLLLLRYVALLCICRGPCCAQPSGAAFGLLCADNRHSGEAAAGKVPRKPVLRLVVLWLLVPHDRQGGSK